MDRSTVAVYEARAAWWAAAREGSVSGEHAGRLAEHVRARLDGAVIADLGCGPGWHSDALGQGPVLALDAARSMLDLVAEHAPRAWRVQADLACLPLRRAALAAAWGSKSYVHLPRRAVPLALAELHRALVPDALAELVVFEGDLEHGELPDDDLGGRRFSLWPAPRLHDVVEGAGFALDAPVRRERRADLRLRLRRLRTLPDVVGPDMHLLLVGLNPSLFAADAGVGFARPGNRFWPAALAAGIVTRDRDPLHALRHHGVGMTDLVKRATARADELAPEEYRRGYARLERLVAWLRPRAVCVIGLSGWRHAVDRRAVAGVQDRTMAGVPVHLMPNTSGLNARVPVSELVDHLRAARSLAG